MKETASESAQAQFSREYDLASPGDHCDCAQCVADRIAAKYIGGES